MNFAKGLLHAVSNYFLWLFGRAGTRKINREKKRRDRQSCERHFVGLGRIKIAGLCNFGSRDSDDTRMKRKQRQCFWKLVYREIKLVLGDSSSWKTNHFLTKLWLSWFFIVPYRLSSSTWLHNDSWKVCWWSDFCLGFPFVFISLFFLLRI